MAEWKLGPEDFLPTFCLSHLAIWGGVCTGLESVIISTNLFHGLEKLCHSPGVAVTFTLDPFQNIPEELTPVATEKYLGGTDDPVKKKDLFLDMMGDMVFGIPAVIVARGHRGESQRLDRKGHQPHQLCCLSCPPLSIDICANC